MIKMTCQSSRDIQDHLFTLQQTEEARLQFKNAGAGGTRGIYAKKISEYLNVGLLDLSDEIVVRLCIARKSALKHKIF